MITYIFHRVSIDCIPQQTAKVRCNIDRMLPRARSGPVLSLTVYPAIDHNL